MESIVRGLVIYTILLVVFRMAGKRTLSETSSFDLILLLIISETVQQALIDSDNSVTNAALLVLTLVGADVLLSIAKQRVPSLERLLDGSPVIVMQDGVVAE